MFTQPLNKEYLEALGLTAVLLLEEALEKHPEALAKVNQLADKGNSGMVDYVTIPEYDLIARMLKASTAEAESENMPDWMELEEKDSTTYVWDVPTGEIAGFDSPADRAAELRILFVNDVIVVIDAHNIE